jgi:hypothetical protein
MIRIQIAVSKYKNMLRGFITKIILLKTISKISHRIIHQNARDISFQGISPTTTFPYLLCLLHHFKPSESVAFLYLFIKTIILMSEFNENASIKRLLRYWEKG